MIIENAIAQGPSSRPATFDIGPLLAELGDDPGLFPELVNYAGDAALFAAPARIAIAGSRDASALGLQHTQRLATAIARRGGLVVSGLARGIDRAAHEGALEAGGRTMAVIATPLEAPCFPPEHADLQARIARDHLLVSPFDAGRSIDAASFLARNRLMVRLCHAAVVVEARPRSGSLAFARAALELRRPLFLLPQVLELAGTEAQALLERGAQILERPSNLFELFPRPGAPSPSRREGRGR